MGHRGGRGGQHILEFAILIGLVTIAAVTMQFLARRGVQTGVRMVNDAVLGPPPAPDLTKEASVTVNLDSTVTEAGDAKFHRVATVSETVTGTSVNEESRLHVLKE
jgi:hypothetical protein